MVPRLITVVFILVVVGQSVLEEESHAAVPDLTTAATTLAVAG